MLSGTATTDIPRSEIEAVASEIADIYGVDASDVETTINYVTSGTLNVIVPEELSQTEVITTLQQSISDVLGIHSSDVFVTVDDDGEVTYSVSSETFTGAEALRDLADNSSFVSQLTDDLIENESGIEVQSSSTDDIIEVVLSSTVDMTDASGTEDASVAIAALAEEHGFTDSITEGNANHLLDPHCLIQNQSGASSGAF